MSYIYNYNNEKRLALVGLLIDTKCPNIENICRKELHRLPPYIPQAKLQEFSPSKLPPSTQPVVEHGT